MTIHAPALRDALEPLVRQAGSKGVSWQALLQKLGPLFDDHAELRRQLRGLTRDGVLARLDRERWAAGPALEAHGRAVDPPPPLDFRPPATIPRTAEGAIDGKAVLRLLDVSRGNVPEQQDRLATLLQVNRPFPPEALAQAQAAHAPGRPGPDDWDLTAVPLCTIDGETAKDFDDAVFAEPIGEDIRLLVAIADVSHYVPEDSALDIDARSRGCSVYLTGRVHPMLPPRLSDDLCSLRPGVLRRCAWASMLIGPDGAVHDTGLGFGVMRSHARLTYQQAQNLLDGAPVRPASARPPAAVLTSLRWLDAAARRLRQMRTERGMLVVDRAEPQVVLSDDGTEVADIVAAPSVWTNRLIEECMVAANEAVARYLRLSGLPAPTRIHPDPADDRLIRLRAALRSIGHPLGRATHLTYNAVQEAMDEIADPGMRQLLSLHLLRAMPRADYGIDGAGHYGIGARDYTHFTSPIRRYPDLMVHRLMRIALAMDAGARPPAAAARRNLLASLKLGVKQANEGEDRARWAERLQERMWRYRYMTPRVGEVFEARITDVLPFGLAVSLEAHWVEGLVPSRAIGDAWLRYDEFDLTLRGRDGTRFGIGDRVRVRCVGVDARECRPEFVVVDADGVSTASARGADRRSPSPRGRRRGEESVVVREEPVGADALRPRRRRR
jgi:ribonuclease R